MSKAQKLINYFESMDISDVRETLSEVEYKPELQVKFTGYGGKRTVNSYYNKDSKVAIIRISGSASGMPLVYKFGSSDIKKFEDTMSTLTSKRFSSKEASKEFLDSISEFKVSKARSEEDVVKLLSLG